MFIIHSFSSFKHSFSLLQTAKFVMKHRNQLTQRVSTAMALADILGDRVHPETYCEIRAEKTPMAQMRTLYTSTIDPGGTHTRAAFYDALMEDQPHLMEDLGEIRSSFIHSFIHYSFIHSFVHSFIHSFIIHSLFIHSFIHSYIFQNIKHLG